MMENISEILKKHYSGTEESLEIALFELKKAGCGQLKATMLLVQEHGFSLFDADRIVLYSKAWEAERDANINLRNEFYDYLSNPEKE